MANINFPSDNQGTQSLKKTNQANSLIADVDAVTPDPQSQKRSSRGKPQFDLDEQTHSEHKSADQPVDKDKAEKKSDSIAPAPRQKYVQRSQDRRHLNRRQKHEQVLLNTRSEHDRRKTPGQRQQDYLPDNTDEQLPDQPPKQFGIDTEA